MAGIYKISGNTVVSLFDQIRRITKTTQAMSFAQATEGLKGITPGASGGGGGSMFSATAVGILPTVYKGRANSEFTLNFESSAVGALSE